MGTLLRGNPKSYKKERTHPKNFTFWFHEGINILKNLMTGNRGVRYVCTCKILCSTAEKI